MAQLSGPGACTLVQSLSGCWLEAVSSEGPARAGGCPLTWLLAGVGFLLAVGWRPRFLMCGLCGLWKRPHSVEWWFASSGTSDAGVGGFVCGQAVRVGAAGSHVVSPISTWKQPDFVFHVSSVT